MLIDGSISIVKYDYLVVTLTLTELSALYLTLSGRYVTRHFLGLFVSKILFTSEITELVGNLGLTYV
jgi:hypothetical protein